MTITATPVRARLAQIAAARRHARQVWTSRFVALTLVATSTGLIVDAAAAVRDGGPGSLSDRMVATAARLSAPAPVAPQRIVEWVGRDLDGDGAADFVNPTGRETRSHDAYGYGYFGASRDGGSRDHEGVDFVAESGQQVVAPISGYVTRIGYPYSGSSLRYVEIANPALRYEARVFYVDPGVRVGQAVRLGDPIGTMDTLQRLYPGGMTDHVHVEITNARGRKIDPAGVIVAQVSYRYPRG